MNEAKSEFCCVTTNIYGNVVAKWINGLDGNKVNGQCLHQHNMRMEITEPTNVLTAIGLDLESSPTHY